MPQTPAGPSWSDIAEWYDELISAGSGAHDTAVSCLLRLLPTLAGESVLDVACGQGHATRAVAAAGAARVVGVDSSAAMIERARRHEDDRGEIFYVLDDAEHLRSFEPASFDGVTCQLALMDIADLDAALAAVHRVLKRGGWFVFVIGHPCFLVPDASPARTPGGRPGVTITGYFQERFWRSTNPNGVRRAGNHHRMLSTYLNALSGAGFTLEAAEEPLPSALLLERQPLYGEVPIFFAGRARR